MQLAISILSSPDAQKTFKASTSTFVQLSSIRKNGESTGARSKAYDQLKVLATQFQSRSLAKIAVEVQAGGHFDKVIVMIDEMISLLRKEEAPARPSESGRTRIWNGRQNPAELRLGTAVRFRPNSDWGRPPESGRKT